MKKNKLVMSAGVFGIVLLSWGVVSAQPATASSPAGPGEQAGTRVRSPEQRLTDARATVDKMKSSAGNIDRMFRQARKAKDVIKSNCLNDKLSQMNVATRSAADRLAAMEVSMKSGGANLLAHDDTVLAVLAGRARELGMEANQCIGTEIGQVGGATLTIKVDPSIPRKDTAATPAPNLVSTLPVAASPTT